MAQPLKASILYAPFGDEVDFTNPSFPLGISADAIVVPNDKNSDPFVWAALCVNHFKEVDQCILVPGRKFDVYGTRHGRGHGWYDRFLSCLPREWIRIGITTESDLSFARLSRQSWDEPMDWLLVFDAITSSWNFYDVRAYLPKKHKKIYLVREEKQAG